MSNVNTANLTQKNEKQDSSGSAAFWLILTLFAASIEPLLVKAGYGSNAFTPIQILYLRSIFAACAALLIIKHIKYPGIRGLLKIAAVAGLLLFTHFASLNALKHIDSSMYITVMSITPATVAIINLFRKKVNINVLFWPGLIIGFVGLIMSIGIENPGSLKINFPGMAFSLAAMISSTIYRIRMDGVTSEYPPIMVSALMFIMHGLFMGLFFSWSVFPVPSQAWAYGLWIGVISILANLAFITALHLAGSTAVSVFNQLQKPLIVLLAAIFLKEQLSAIQFAGIALVFLGVWMAKAEKKKD
jgi:drug/metabolite transporter (DMT)-like permease